MESTAVDVSARIVGATSAKDMEAGRPDRAVVLVPAMSVGKEHLAVGVEEVGHAESTQVESEMIDDLPACLSRRMSRLASAQPELLETREENAEGPL